MRKFNLKVGGIKEMLSREQMRKISGGYGCDVGYIGDCNSCRTLGGTMYQCYISTLGNCLGKQVQICALELPTYPGYSCWTNC